MLFSHLQPHISSHIIFTITITLPPSTISLLLLGSGSFLSGVPNEIQVFEESFQFPFTKHGGDNITSPDKLLIHIQLRNGWPIPGIINA